MWWFKLPILRLRDIQKFHDKTSYIILMCPELAKKIFGKRLALDRFSWQYLQRLVFQFSINWMLFRSITNQPTNQPINQPTNQPTNHPIIQPSQSVTKLWGSPWLLLYRLKDYERAIANYWGRFRNCAGHIKGFSHKRKIFMGGSP